VGAVLTTARQRESVALKRRSPRFWWDHDWYVLRELRRGIEAVLDRPDVLRTGQRVVDFGCGDRPYQPLLEARGARYVACDLEGEVDVRIEPGQPLQLPDEDAEGVVSFQVLEHVWDLDWYLSECRRLLKPGGWMLLSTHGTWLYHPHPTDFRRWTRDGLTGEIAARGFEIVDVRPIVGPLAWTTLFRLFALRHILTKVPLLGPLALVPSVCFMNARMLVEDAVTPAGLRDTNASVYIVLARKPGNAPETASP
jgi:SAM-dependent methyltransferase